MYGRTIFLFDFSLLFFPLFIVCAVVLTTFVVYPEEIDSFYAFLVLMYCSDF